MHFTRFKFENFKGIGNQTLDLSRNNESKVFTLVGLNESGKTTILEAINYFKYKQEALGALQVSNYEVKDIHNLIPINKRDNFNGKIVIQAEVQLDDDDIDAIKEKFKEIKIAITKVLDKTTYTQTYHFENSIHIKEKDLFTWKKTFWGRIGKARTITEIGHEHALIVNSVIKERMPNILYFPNFLFEFPERIYLTGDVDERHQFYQKIVQDVLDSLNNGTNIQDHIVKRIESSDENEKRNLTSLIGKMQQSLSKIIFTKWNLIFNKQISKTEIILVVGKDPKGCYIEFNIKDNVDTYKIGERSLGFRWFFVYILLTQFRGYRRNNQNVLFLFDEPASNLHPSAQSELLKSFEKLSRVIYTTHSHYLINPQWLESTFVIKNEAIDYDNEEDYSSKNTDIKIFKYRDFATKHPDQSSYFQPILEVLDYRPSNLELVPNVVITEGKNDFYVLSYYNEVIKPNSPRLNIVPGTSSSNLESIISLYLGWGKKFVVLLDSDKEGHKQKARYLDLFGQSLSDRIFTYEDIVNSWSNMEVEGLFSKEDKLQIQNAFYPTDKADQQFDKKNFNRSLQELLINKKIVSLSLTTKENLEKVVAFLALKLSEK